MKSNGQQSDKTRDRQTRRTRRALVEAADAIFAEGGVPTVAEVAERADVSRATAYRYFPTHESLLLETSHLGDSEPMRTLVESVQDIEDPAERIAEAVRRGAEWTLGREARLRAILRVSLDPAAGTKRPARRRGYIKELLDPIRGELSPQTYERLTGSLTLLFGVDPIVSLRDNGDVPVKRIPDTLAWSARTLVNESLQESR
jgi:AcrR family transcriptional regulator